MIVYSFSSKYFVYGYSDFPSSCLCKIEDWSIAKKGYAKKYLGVCSLGYIHLFDWI